MSLFHDAYAFDDVVDEELAMDAGAGLGDAPALSDEYASATPKELDMADSGDARFDDAHRVDQLPGMNNRRVILDAALDRSVIRGTLTTADGDRREFHGWLEPNTALEALLGSSADHAASSNPATVAIPDPREAR